MAALTRPLPAPSADFHTRIKSPHKRSLRNGRVIQHLTYDSLVTSRILIVAQRHKCTNPLCNLALDFSNIGSLRPLQSLHNLELDHVSFLQSAITFTDNRGIVNENIRVIDAPDEAIPFRVIEPLHGAAQFRSLPKDGCISSRLLAERILCRLRRYRTRFLVKGGRNMFNITSNIQPNWRFHSALRRTLGGNYGKAPHPARG